MLQLVRVEERSITVFGVWQESAIRPKTLFNAMWGLGYDHVGWLLQTATEKNSGVKLYQLAVAPSPPPPPL